METWNYYKNYIIAVLLFLSIVLFLPADRGLTRMGVQVMGILAAVLYLWLFQNTDWVSLLALGALIMSGVMTPAEIYQQSMGHTIVMTIIACMALNACLLQTGVINKIATWFITRKIVHNRPYIFMGMFLLSYLVLGLFMETLSLAIIYISIAEALCRPLGYQKGDSFYTAMMMSILWGNAVATAASPISHALPMILIAQVEATMGVTISYAQWLSIGIPYTILMFVLAMIIVRFVWKPDAEKFNRYDIDTVKRSSQPLGKEGKIAAVIFLILIMLWIIPEIGKDVAPGFCAYMTGIGTSVPPILAVALLCIIRVNKKPIAEFQNIVKDIPLGVLIFTGTVTVFGNVISLESTGISLWLSNILKPLTAGMPAIVLIGVILFGALILTNFLSNTVTMLLFYSISAALLGNTGINLIALTILIGLFSCFGILTPSAAVPAPLFFGPGHINVKTTVKYNTSYILLAFISSMLILWPAAQLIVR